MGDVSSELFWTLESLLLDISEGANILFGPPTLHLQCRYGALEGDDIDIILKVDGLGRGHGDGGYLLWMCAVREDGTTGIAAAVSTPRITEV
jgi:hypothetical protein